MTWTRSLRLENPNPVNLFPQAWVVRVLPNTGVAILANCRFGNTRNTNERDLRRITRAAQRGSQCMFVVAATFTKCGMRTISND